MEAVEGFLRENLPKLQNSQLSKTQIEGVIKMINDWFKTQQKLPSGEDLKNLA